MSAPPPESAVRPRTPSPGSEAALGLHATISAAVGLLCTLIWLAADRGYFWPMWVWLGLLVPVLLHAGLWQSRLPTCRRRRALAAHAVVAAVAAVTVVVVALLAGARGWWLVWPLGGLATVVLAHAAAERLTRR